jgi:hypothetical protein
MKTLIFSIVCTLMATTFMTAQSTAVTGRNATLVKFGNSSSSFLGTYVMRGGDKQWVEEGKQQGAANFKFRETHRDDWSVYLVDDSRGVNIQLDLHTKKVMYSDKKNPTRRALYNITERYAGATGWTACNVKFGHASGGVLGSYVQTNGKSWVEKNAAGKVGFNFKETGRDEWSVYLRDDSRGVNIQLDLHTKKVMYSDKKSPRRVQYTIKSAS